MPLPNQSAAALDHLTAAKCSMSRKGLSGKACQERPGNLPYISATAVASLCSPKLPDLPSLAYQQAVEMSAVARQTDLLVAFFCLRMTMPQAVQGNCVVSLTRTRMSVSGQPSHSSVGFKLVAVVVVASNDRLSVPTGCCCVSTAALCSCAPGLCLRWSGRTSLQGDHKP